MHMMVDMAFQSGQNCQQFSFHGQTSIFMVKTFIFVVNTDFLMFRPEISWSLGQSPFHSNAKISYSTLSNSNFMLNSVPFSHDFMVSDSLDLPAPEVSHALLLTIGVSLSVHWEQLQYFTDDVGSRVVRIKVSRKAWLIRVHCHWPWIRDWPWNAVGMERNWA